ncbi:transporter [Trypanosoma theileri]|uniref:Transporter n=1 Tax=Trypanosoma theileri TaxID=67003 RepID=A0A1X0P6F8_9TRYP|nr:transporter [Trypanosoma theileri]ORC92455.1 transporter [Trypanosoma theileri]
MGTLQLITITAETVGKILLCALAGLRLSHYFVAPAKSLRGLSAISLLVFLPCLLFGNLVLRLTWSALGHYYWAPLLACVPTVLGAIGSFLFRPLLDPHWHGVLTLGCTFQNGLTFGLSIVMTLKGVAWLTPEAVERATSYIFLYNIVCSIGLWAIGEPLIKSCKKRLVQERLARRRIQQEQQQQQQEEQQEHREEISGCMDSENRIVYPYGLNNSSIEVDRTVTASDIDNNAVESTPNQNESKKERRATVEEQFVWYRPSDNAPPISFSNTTGNDNNNNNNNNNNSNTILSTLWEVLVRIPGILKSPPVCATLSAIVISLVPPLRWLAESPPGDVIIGGMKIIGAGAIPLQLLLLGCNVAGSRPPPLENKNRPTTGGKHNRDDEDNEDEEEDGDNDNTMHTVGISDGQRRCMKFFSISQPTLFAILTVSLRLVFIPLVCFVIIHFLRVGGIIPPERDFLLSVLLGTCAPSAINSSLICTMHSYKARPYAQMIFVMYVTAIGTTAFWLTFYIWYLGE